MTGFIAISLAAFVAVVPASLAQDVGKPAGTGVSVAIPTGKVAVSPQSVDGAPVYVRRTSPIGGMTIVEVSPTPFMPAVDSKEDPSAGAQLTLNARPEAQPAGW